MLVITREHHSEVQVLVVVITAVEHVGALLA